MSGCAPDSGAIVDLVRGPSWGPEADITLFIRRSHRPPRGGL